MKETGKSILTKTDSYKIGSHWNMLPENVRGVYSYFEARKGAKYDKTVFYGLQAILKDNFLGQVVTREKIEDAAEICKYHFDNDKAFNRKGWEYILNECGGVLPLEIKAVAEGSIVPVDNVLFTVENTDWNVPWLTSYAEGILSHTWAPSTVATYAYENYKQLNEFWDETADNKAGLQFQLHGFGYRSVSSDQSSAILDSAPLLFFRGTDSVPSLEFARDYYGANLASLAFSVPASEHSLMASGGVEGEANYTSHLIDLYPSGILSIVGDTYNIYNFVDNIVGTQLKEKILAREGVFVVRPDSNTPKHRDPEDQVIWILDSLSYNFGFTVNLKGFKVVNPKLKVLWGDGIDIDGIKKICVKMMNYGYSIENIVFGMGGNYVQKGIYRDLQRFAFKCSSQLVEGKWRDIQKNPLDSSKTSKKGRLKLIKENGIYQTISIDGPREDQLITVFKDGELLKDWTFDEVRANAGQG